MQLSSWPGTSIEPDLSRSCLTLTSMSPAPSEGTEHWTTATVHSRGGYNTFSIPTFGRSAMAFGKSAMLPSFSHQNINKDFSRKLHDERGQMLDDVLSDMD